MPFWKKKINSRRSYIRQGLTEERLARLNMLAAEGVPGSIALFLIFVIIASLLFSFTFSMDAIEIKSAGEIFCYIGLLILVAAAGGIYIFNYQRRIVQNNLRGFALICLFLILLAATKLGMLFTTRLGISIGTR